MVSIRSINVCQYIRTTSDWPISCRLIVPLWIWPTSCRLVVPMQSMNVSRYTRVTLYCPIICRPIVLSWPPLVPRALDVKMLFGKRPGEQPSTASTSRLGDYPHLSVCASSVIVDIFGLNCSPPPSQLERECSEGEVVADRRCRTNEKSPGSALSSTMIVGWPVWPPSDSFRSKHCIRICY